MNYYCHNGGCKFDCSVEITENIDEGRKIAPPLNCLQWENGYPQTVESPAWRTYSVDASPIESKGKDCQIVEGEQ